MTERDWAAIAREVGYRRNTYIQRGDDYATADANALRDQLHSWAEAVDQVDAYLRDTDRWMGVARAAELEAGQLRQQLDLTAVARVGAVLDTLAAVPRQKTATHHADCWTKHPGCLAARVGRQLDGQDA